MRTHYDNLKVPETATRDAIKASYRQLCLKYHPDRNPGNPDCERIMRIINDAYDILSDPGKRRAYDQDLALRRARGDDRPQRQTSQASRSTQRRSQATWQNPYQPQPRASGGPSYRQHPYGWPPYTTHRWNSYPAPADAARKKARFTVGMGMLILVIAAANLYHGRQSSLPWSGSGSPTSGTTTTVHPGGAGKSDRKEITPLQMLGLLGGASPHRRGDSYHRTPDLSSYVRPAKAPNGYDWPSEAAYMPGYPLAATGGESRLTLDNTETKDDVFVKVISFNQGTERQVRTCYLPAYSAFTAMMLQPGAYELRYQNLATGEVRKTDIFHLQETHETLGVRATNIRFTLFAPARLHWSGSGQPSVRTQQMDPALF